MSEKESEQVYPVRTLHEFVYEINREWGVFKKGALISITISSLLLVATVLLVVRTMVRGMEISDIILEMILAGFLVYSIYLMNHQYCFFRKWEKRTTHLAAIEEKLMPEQTEEKKE